MCRVHAAVIIAPMTHHVIIARHHLVQDAVHEAVGGQLPSLEPHPPCTDRRRLDAASLRALSCLDQGALVTAMCIRVTSISPGFSQFHPPQGQTQTAISD